MLEFTTVSGYSNGFSGQEKIPTFRRSPKTGYSNTRKNINHHSLTEDLDKPFPMNLKNFLPLLLGAVLLVLNCETVLAQPCDNNNTLIAAPNDTIRLAGPGDTVDVACVLPGEYLLVELCQGASYSFSTCGGTIFDTKLTLYRDGFPPYIIGNQIAFNDDACGGVQSQINYTSSFNGFAQVVLDLIFIGGCDHIPSNCVYMQFWQNTPCCAYPPTDAGPDITACAGDTVRFLGDSAIVYSWSPTIGFVSPTNAQRPFVIATGSGDITYYLVGSNACGPTTDSMVLTVNPLPVFDLPDTSYCEGETISLSMPNVDSCFWTPNIGITDTLDCSPTFNLPTDSVIYYATAQDTNGCRYTDSVIIRIDSLPQAVAGNDVPICEGDTTQLLASGGISYSWSPGNTLSDSTIINPFAFPTVTTSYIVTVINAAGCADLDTVIVTVLPHSFTTVDDTVCQGETVSVLGNTYGSTGTFIDTTTAANTCDSIVTLNLLVLPHSSTTIDTSLCNGDSIVMLGTTYNTTGSFTDTVPSANGCDSAVILNLTMLPHSSTTIDTSICLGDSVVMLGISYTSNGTFLDTTVSANGCDSTLTLNLTVISPASTTVDSTICDGETVMMLGNPYTTTGTFIDTVSFGGCDSIVTLNLTVNLHSATTVDTSICDGDSVMMLGTNYGSTGTFLDTTASANGCDSVVTLNLTILPHSATTVDTSVCDGDSVLMLGNNYGATGTFIDTTVSGNGCDSVITLNLTILPHSTTTVDTSLCDGLSFTMLGTTYNTTGTFVDTTVSANGCDSIVTLNLTILPHSATTVDTSLCQGDSIAMLGNSYGSTGTFIDTTVSANGCDSVVTLNLTILPHSFTTVDTSICFGDSVAMLGNSYGNTGSFVDTTVSANGCDSVVTLNLTILPHSASTVDTSVCDGDSVMMLGTNYGATGSFVDTTVSANGCDSVVTLNLTILPHSTTTVDTSLCDGLSFTMLGQAYNTTGTFIDTTVSANGCDSIVTLNLTILPHSATTVDTSICQGDSIMMLGTNYGSTGSFVDTTVSANGCDSVVTLNLTILPHSFTTVDTSICSGDSVMMLGTNYGTTGSFVDTTVSGNGCDSVVTLNLTILPHSATTVDTSVCDGDSVMMLGTNYGATGSFVDTTVSANGCDSVITLNLTILPHTTTTVDTSLCDGLSFTMLGTAYNTTGTFVDTTVSANGCDSIVTLNLTILPHSATTVDTSVCQGDSVMMLGNNYGSAGSFVDTTVSANGCDSVVTLNLTILPHSTTTVDTSVCDGDSVMMLGTNYGSTGSFVDTTISANGCDSIVTLNLTILPHSTTTIDTSVCDGISVDMLGNSYNTTGSFVDTTVSANGCDSIVTLNLTILPHISTTVDTSVCDGISVSMLGNLYNTTGSFMDTTVSANGCDSIVTLNLTILPHSATTVDTSVCDGATVSMLGNTYGTAGTFIDTTVSANGCDSIVTLNLTILPHSTTTVDTSVCDGISVSMLGNLYGTAGTFIDTTVSANGCDSIVTLNLTILPHSATTVDTSVCDGISVSMLGNLYGTAGTFIDTTVSANGCDSVVTLNLTILPHVSTTVDTSVCDGISVSMLGNLYNTSGTFIDTTVSANGCDSIVTLNLTILPHSSTTVDTSVCDGISVSMLGNLYSTAGTFIDTTVSANGCDSIVTLNLTILPHSTTTVDTSVCDGVSVSMLGNLYNTTGTFIDTTVSANGCDSIVTLNLTILPHSATTVDTSVCDGISVSMLGNLYGTAGTFTDTTVSANGCDSVVTLNLTILPHVSTTVDTSVCDGISVSMLGNLYNTTGSFIDTTVSSNGCDSIVTLNLTILPHSSTTVDTSVCDGISVSMLGNLYSTSGTFIDTTVSANGCDSIVTLNLTILPHSATTVDTSVCDGTTVDMLGSSYGTAGTFIDTTVSANGCDSIVTLNLTINPNHLDTFPVTLCFGDSIFAGGGFQSTPGVYIDTFPTINSCDSVVVTDLSIDSFFLTPQSPTICDGEMFIFLGDTFTATGTYFDTLQAINGCDSIIQTDLTVLLHSASTIDTSFCDGDTVTILGNVLTTSSTILDTIPSANGCDSVVTINTTVLPNTASTIDTSVCDGIVVNILGTNYSTTGTFFDTIASAQGCDSVLTINVTILPHSASTIDTSICDGTTIVLGGNNYSSAGTFLDTVPSSNGCDSVITVNVTVNPVDSTTVPASICQGDTFNFAGTPLITTGIYLDTFLNANGCDSIVTVDLAVDSIILVTLNPSICQGDTFFFGTQPITIGGIYTDTSVSVLGCDSLTILNLTVNPVITTNLMDSICDGDTIVFANQTITAAGVYVDSSQTSANCDSVTTLTVTLLPNTSTTIDTTICDGTVIVLGGTNYSAAGSFIDTIPASNGCDSVVTVNVTVNPVDSTTVPAAICQGDTFNFGGTPLITSGVYVDTFPNVNGCDSIVTVDLAVDSIILVTLNPSICQGDTFFFGTQPITVGGTYTDTSVSVLGCDSLTILNLTVNPIITTNLTDSICDGDSILFAGQTITTAGVYVDSSQTSANCDSVTTLTVTLLPNTATTIDTTICDGTVIVLGGTSYSTAGSFIDTIPGANGCDSVVTVNVTVNPVDSTTVPAAICQGDTFNFGGTPLIASGVYVDTFPNVNGCDSIVTVDLAVDSIILVTLNPSICQGDTFFFGPQPITVGGTYTDTSVSVLGCDSLTILNLTVNPIITTNLTDSICDGDTIFFASQTITAAGVYVDSSQTSANCDSVTTLTVTLLSNTSTTIDTTICDGTIIVLGGTNYSAAGSFIDTIPSANGCDSVVTVNVTVNPVDSTAIPVAICQGDSFNFAGTQLTSTGIYVDTFANGNGCDSIVTIDLTVDSIILVNLNPTICDGDTFFFGPTPLTTAGIYTDTSVSSIGCDSLTILDLNVDSVILASIIAEICDLDTFFFNGTPLTLGGVYGDTTTSSLGCDSITTLTLTVHPIYFTQLADTMNAGDTILFGSHVITTAGIYLDTTLSVNNCDSTLELTVVVLNAITAILDTSICAGDSIVLNSTTYTAAGSYIDTLVASGGADSILTINITIIPTVFDTIAAAICQGDTFNFAGQILTSSGQYVDSTTSILTGCDSVTTLNLSVDSIILVNQTASICTGDTFMFGNNTLTVGGIYGDTSVSVNGCDSLTILDLTVNSVISINLADSICLGDSIVFASQTITTAGTFTDSSQTSSGCDSITTLTVTLLPNSASTIDTLICEGNVLTLNGTNYAATGSYLDTVPATNGCDSIITINLTVDTVAPTNLNASICQGDTFSFGINQLTTSGIYNDTVPNVNGCDSILILNLSVDSVLITNIDTAFCQGDSIIIDGQTITTTGTVIDSTVSTSGCDSLIIYNVTVDTISTTNITSQICQGDTLLFGSHVITIGGVYGDTLANQTGCDSIVINTVTVNSVLTTNLADSLCAGDTILFNLQLITTAGTYVDTFNSANNCDSVVTLTVTQLPNSTATIDTAICDGDTYTFNGIGYTVAGTYNDTIPATNGCDSIVTINLTVDTIPIVNITAAICQGDSFSFGGNSLTSAGAYNDTSTANSGCDSITILTLSVDSVLITNIDTSFCQGSSIVIDGQTITTAGVVIDSFVSTSNCDSLVIYNVTIDSVSTGSTTSQICQGDTLFFGTNIITTPGTYFDTLVGPNGCDSILSNIVSVVSVITVNLADTICPGDSVIFDGQTITAGGTFIDTSASVGGCDSVTTLVVTQLLNSSATIDTSICAGDTIMILGNQLTVAGTTIDTISATNGCDSIVTINVTLNPVLTNSISDTVCSGDSILFAGQLVGTAGVYADTTESQSTSCDSIINLTLVVLNHASFNDTISICNGDSVLVGGGQQTTSGNYVDTLTASNGCDSVVFTNLTVLSDTTITNPVTICIGDSVLAGGAQQTTSGQYTDVYVGSNGCDSTVITDLTVLPDTTITVLVSICDGQSHFAGGTNQTNTGIYFDTLPALNGCDSIIITDLTVVALDSTFGNQTICQGDSAFLSNNWQFTAGVYRDTFVDLTSGCDSFRITTLAVTAIVSENVTATICEKDSIFLQNNWQNTAGTYFDTTTSVVTGCDSIIITALTVNLDPVAIVTGDNTPCVGDATQIFASGGVTYIWSPSAGLDDPNIADPFASPFTQTLYTVTVTDANGCYDTASITIYPQPFGIQMPDTSECILDSIILQAPEIVGATYSWSPPDGLSSTIIPNPIATPTQNTVYTVTVIDDNGCEASASTLVTVCPIEIKPIYIPNAFSPNGDAINDVFYVYGSTIKFLRMTIFNRWGELVFESTDQRIGWDGIYHNKPLNPAVFVYKIGITFDDETKVLRTGSVTLLR